MDSRTRKTNPESAILLFGSFCDFRALNDQQLSIHNKFILKDLDDRLKRYSPSWQSAWGKYFVCMFETITGAANAALDIRDYFARQDWQRRQMPNGYGIRLHLRTCHLLGLNSHFDQRQDAALQLAIEMATELDNLLTPGLVWARPEIADQLRAAVPQTLECFEAKGWEDPECTEERPLFVVARVNEPKSDPPTERSGSHTIQLKDSGYNGLDFHKTRLAACERSYTVISTRNSKLFADSHSVEGFLEQLSQKIRNNLNFKFRAYFIDPDAPRALREVIVKLMRTYATRSQTEPPKKLADDLTGRISESIRNAQEIYHRLKHNLKPDEFQRAKASVHLLKYSAVPIIPMVVADEEIYSGFPVLVWGESQTSHNDCGFTDGPYIRIVPETKLYRRLLRHEKILRSISKDIPSEV